MSLNGPGFTGQIVPLSEFERKFFNGVNVIKRVYTVEGQNYFLTVLDGTNNRHIVHDPYYCFEGSGWNITQVSLLSVPGGNANLVHINKDGAESQALFWFSDGTSRYTSPLRYWLEATLRRISLGYSGPEPVLIMIQPMNNNDKNINWHQTLNALHPVLQI